MKSRYKIIEKTPDQLQWDFDSNQPSYALETGEWKRTERVDPCAAYPHPKRLVESLAKQVTSLFGIGWQTKFFLLHHECIGRTNGHMSYNDNSQKDPGPYIVLSGKRIPPITAMTRYLVAHEYGHVVDMWLARCMEEERRKSLTKAELDKISAHAMPTDIRKQYVKVRRLKNLPQHYGPGTWHNSPGEILANDFRIIFCNAEPDFWPHYPVPHPLSPRAQHVRDFWQQMKEKYAR